MQRQGLLSLGYSYEEPDETSVQFCFSKPHTVQPGASPKTRAIIQEVNKRIVAEYDSICEKHNILEVIRKILREAETIKDDKKE